MPRKVDSMQVKDLTPEYAGATITANVNDKTITGELVGLATENGKAELHFTDGTKATMPVDTEITVEKQ